MSVKRPKIQQGRKCQRIKPALHVPGDTTKFHRRIDQLLDVKPRRHVCRFKPIKVQGVAPGTVEGCNCGIFRKVAS